MAPSVGPRGPAGTRPSHVETETLPDGKTAVAFEAYPNAYPGAITVYSFSRDRPGHSACSGACAVTWIPVLTTGMPKVADGIAAKDVGIIRRPDGTTQVTYAGKPLYLYSAEKEIIPTPGQPPQSTGTAGNGNGLRGPGGGGFSIVFPL